MAGRRVIVIGEAILDAYATGHVARLCREAPVPILDVDRWVDAPGGAANTAANIRALGGEPILVSAIGDDAEGARLRGALRKQGVHDAGVLGIRGRQTLSRQRLLAGDQLLLRFDAGTATPLDDSAEARLIGALWAAHADADAILVSDYEYGVLTPRVREALRELQARRPLPLVVDARSLEPYRECRPTAVKPNYTEAVRLLGLDELHDHAARPVQIGAAGDRLLELTGASLVALTLDQDGAIAFEAGRPAYRTYARPSPPSRAAGAGDTV